jgi:hypothetical protein
MNPVILNAVKLLNLMVEDGEDKYENDWLQKQSGLDPKEINASISYLERQGVLQSIKAMVTAPFDFKVVRLFADSRFLYHDYKEKYPEVQPNQNQVTSNQHKLSKEWDLFISHASEDKEIIARPLAKALIKEGFSVWFDEFTLTLGDSLHRSIDKGLLNSRFGVVILSPNFFSKEWPQKELDGLVAREHKGVKVILPIWHNVTYEDVLSFSPILADRLGVRTAKGLDYMINEIKKACGPPQSYKI